MRSTSPQGTPNTFPDVKLLPQDKPYLEKALELMENGCSYVCNALGRLKAQDSFAPNVVTEVDYLILRIEDALAHVTVTPTYKLWYFVKQHRPELAGEYSHGYGTLMHDYRIVWVKHMISQL